MKKRYITILIAIVLIFTLVYFMNPGFRTVKCYDAANTSLIVDGVRTKGISEPVVENGEVMLSVATIKKYLDPTVIWDAKTKKIVFTTNDKVVKMKTDNLTAMINSKPVELNLPAKLIDNEPYLPVGFVSELLRIKVSWNISNNVVIIDKNTTKIKLAEVQTDKLTIRMQPTIWSPKVKAYISKGDKLKIYSDNKSYFRIATEDGIIGYAKKKDIKVVSLENPKEEEYTTQAAWKPKNGKLVLAWEAVYSKNPNTSKIKAMTGLDVVSPTWFAVADETGKITNHGDKNYSNWAHRNGYKVWGLVSSFDPDITHKVMENTDIREKLIQQMLIYSKLYELDGINIDFENVYMKDKDKLTQLVRELVPLFHEQGLVVSMDVATISNNENWSLCYDRKALGQAADYIALMTYDQYYSKSKKAGSVAQLSWVEYNVKALLKEVPAEKLLLGVPFYMREWTEEEKDGQLSVSSKVLTMDTIQTRLNDKKPKIIWDEKSGQYYAEFKEGSSIHRIWIEDTRSINVKSALVHKYGLAGIAAWRRGFESQDIWSILEKNLKQTKSFDQWAEANIGVYTK